MIAKYTLYNDEYYISERALEKLNSDNIDLDKRYSRISFYGSKKPYIYEHAIPAKVIRDLLLKCKSNEVKSIFDKAGIVALILKEEDKELNNCDLKSTMPDGWEIGDDPKLRYKKSGIDISEKN